MSPNPEVEDSQIVEPDYRPSANDPNYMSSLSSQYEESDSNTKHRSSHARHLEIHNDARSLEEEVEDSNTSEIEETQFQSIELAHEQQSFPSVIEDTQYTTIEPATQILAEGTKSRHSDPMSPSLVDCIAPAGSTPSLDVLSPYEFVPLSRARESLIDIGKDFSFGYASKPPNFSTVIGAKTKTGREGEFNVQHGPVPTLYGQQEQKLELLIHPKDISPTVPVPPQQEYVSNLEGGHLLGTPQAQQECGDPEIQSCSLDQCSTSQPTGVIQSFQQVLVDTHALAKIVGNSPELQDIQTAPEGLCIQSQEQRAPICPESNNHTTLPSGNTGESLLVLEHTHATKPSSQILDEIPPNELFKPVTETGRQGQISKLRFGAKKRPKNAVPFPDVALNLGSRRVFSNSSLKSQNHESPTANYAASNALTGPTVIAASCENDNTALQPFKLNKDNHSMNPCDDTSSIWRINKQSPPNFGRPQVVSKLCHVHPLNYPTNPGSHDEQPQSSVSADVEEKHTSVEKETDGSRIMETLSSEGTPTDSVLNQEEVEGRQNPTIIESRIALHASGSINDPGIEIRQNNNSNYVNKSLEEHVSIVHENIPLSTDSPRQLQQISDRNNIRFFNNSKVMKTKTGHNSGSRGVNSKTPAMQSGHNQHDSGIVSDYQKFLKSGQAFQEQLYAYEKQKKLVESQNAEIMRLNLSGVESSNRIKSLEEQNQNLAQMFKKLNAASEKYRIHVNGVVKAQNKLINSADKIRNETKRLHEDMQQAKNESETSIKAAGDGVQNALHTLQIGVKFKKLKEDTLRYNSDLEVQIKGLKLKNLWLQRDLNERLLDLGRERHNTEQLHKQLNGQAQKHKQLVELIESDSPSNVLQELTKNGGVIQTLLASGNSTHERLEELSTILNTLKSTDQEISPALVKLIENSYARIETRLQSSDNDRVAQADTATKLSEGLKEIINQVGVDQEAQGVLNDQITDLREENADIAANFKAKKLECQGLETRIEELRQELTSSRDQLKVKSDELTAFLAKPHDDFVLRTKISSLDAANANLRGESDTFKHDLIRIQDEMRALESSSDRSQDQIRELEEKLNNAQESLNNAVNEKRMLLETFKAEVAKAKQEVGKSADLAKKEAQMHHESQIKNLEHLRSEAVARVHEVETKLRNSEDEKSAHANNIKRLQSEILGHKEKLNTQATQIEQLCLRPTTQEVDNRVSVITDQLNYQAARIEELELQRKNQADLEFRERQIQTTRGEVIKIQTDLENIRTEFSKKLSTALQNYTEIESRLQQVHTLEMEKETLMSDEQRLKCQQDILEAENFSLKQDYIDMISEKDTIASQITELEGEKNSLNGQNQQLQKRYDSLATAISRYLRRQGILNAGEQVDDWAANVPAKTPEKLQPVYPTPEEAIQAALDRSYTAAGCVKDLLEHHNGVRQGNTTTALVGTDHNYRSQNAAGTPTFLQRGLELGGRSLHGGTPRSLKPANRKSSSLTQQFNVNGEPSTRIESSSYIESTTTHTTQRRCETITRLETPVNQVVPALQRSRAASSKLEAPADPSTPFSQRKVRKITGTAASADPTIPFSQTLQTERSSDSSPLSDVEASAIVEGGAIYQQNSVNTSTLPNDSIVNTAQNIAHSTQKSSIILRKKVTAPKYVFSDPSDEIVESGLENTKKQDQNSLRSITTSNEATSNFKTPKQPKVSRNTPMIDPTTLKVRPLISKPLKSAMKKTDHYAMTNANLAPNSNAIKDPITKEYASGNHPLRNIPMARGSNKKVSGSMGGASGISVVKGLVSGTNPVSNNPAHTIHNSPRKSRTSGAKANFHERSQTSPLMSAPQRNLTKRKASDELKDFIASSKPAKAPRHSSHFSSTLRKEVLDSQEYPQKYHY